MPSIKRKTDKGLPQYSDDIDSDTYLFSGAEDLVPLLIFNEANKKWECEAHINRNLNGISYKIKRYKPRIEGLFARIECWTETVSGKIKWRVITKDNVTTLFGWSDNSVIADPKDEMKIFEWQTFRNFQTLPNINFNDGNTRMLDLNGDGKPDLLMTEENVFTWYESAGKNGFTNIHRTAKPYDEEAGPNIVFADSTQSIFLADMSGDGLSDIVRIRNGEVCYWPNLGFGKFGTKVGMDDSPWFDHPDAFNPSYLRLADIDGSGTTDIVYLGKNKFICWSNLSGNSFSKVPFEIEAFPEIHNNAKVTVADLLGNGVACIVWSSPLGKDANSPLLYIDLMNSRKPHIMLGYKNNLGKKVSLEYKPSTCFYIEDKLAGKPWVTKLHFPVHCVSKTTVKDSWRKSTFSSSYSYHHGYYDHNEREFRGFGRVEQTDVEDFGTFASGNVSSPYITDDHTLYQPPVKTITWYHTGACTERDRILNQFQHEFFAPGSGLFTENTFPEPDIADLDLNPGEWCEALRACKGMMLRQEVYELDVDAFSNHEEKRVKLFSTAFHNCHIKCLEPRSQNLHAVFLVTESEAITYNYELDLRQAVLSPDPRIAHSLNLCFDDYGRALQTVAVVYPRFDYRVLVPIEMVDVNGNHSEVAVDILGLVVASAIKGKKIGTDQWEGDNDWNSINSTNKTTCHYDTHDNILNLADVAPDQYLQSHHLFEGEQRMLLVDDVIVTSKGLPYPRPDGLSVKAQTLFRYQYSNHLGSACLELDEESSLSYHTARYYLPWLGRWASCDPFDIIDSTNLYSFVRANPISFSDENGHYSKGGSTTSPEYFTTKLRKWAPLALKDRIVSAGAAGEGLSYEEKQLTIMRVFIHDFRESDVNQQIVKEVDGKKFSYYSNFLQKGKEKTQQKYLDVGLPLDIEHFFFIADLTRYLPDWAIRLAYIHEEQNQAKDTRPAGRTSAFAPEDLFSNELGLIFGNIMSKTPDSADFATELQNYLMEIKTLFTTNKLENGKYLTKERVKDLREIAEKYYGTDNLRTFLKTSKIFEVNEIMKINDNAAVGNFPFYNNKTSADDYKQIKDKELEDFNLGYPSYP